MSFGEHKGKHLKDVPASYFIYLHEENIAFGPIKRYIEDNLDVFYHEVNQK